MARILFAWEMGANLGHLCRDLPLLRACRAAGHEVVIAVPILRTAAQFLQNEQVTLVQAPILRSSIPRNTAPINYPDMLLHAGYDDPDTLFGAIQGWKGLFSLVAPSVIVYNHAPTVLIAARSVNIPVAVIGTGFEVPPACSPMPSFRPQQMIPDQVLLHAETQVLTNIQSLLEGTVYVGTSPLHKLFYSSSVHLTTFPELDPFGSRDNVHYVGSLYAIPQALPSRWNTASSAKIVVYIRPAMGRCELFLNALNQLDAEVICAIPGVPPEWLRRYSNVRISSEVLDLTNLLTDASLVVTYGVGTVATSLLAGVPVLLFPQTTEQYLSGLALEKTGAGMMLHEPGDMKKGIDLMQSILHDAQFRLAAKEFANRHKEFSVEKACQQLIDKIIGD